MFVTFVHCLQALEIPLACGLIIWAAIRQDRHSGADDVGIELPPPARHPRRPSPRGPRRGPHGDPAPASPSRIRAGRARARTLDH